MRCHNHYISIDNMQKEFHWDILIKSDNYLLGYHIKDNNILYIIANFENYNITNITEYTSLQEALLIFTNRIKEQL